MNGSRHWILLGALAVAFVCSVSRSARASTANVAIIVPGNAYFYDPGAGAQNLVAVPTGATLVSIDKTPVGAPVACPATVPAGDTCYPLTLAAAAFDPSTKTASVTLVYTLAGAAAGAAPTTATITLPQGPAAAAAAAAAPASFVPGCPARPFNATELAYRQAVMQSSISDHQCDEPGPVYENGIAIVLYDEQGHPLWPVPQIDETDTIYAAVASQDSSVGIEDLRVSKCDAPTALRVGGTSLSTSSLQLRGGAAPQLPSYAVVVAHSCNSDSGAVIGLKTKNGSQETSTTITVPTLPVYRITIGISLLYDAARQTTFSSAAIKGESVPVIVQNDQAGGLEAVAFIALRLKRVDLVKVRSADDPFTYVSPTVGVSLTAPTQNLFAGLLLDPVPGLGLVGGWHFHTTQTLAGGYQVNDRIPGGQIPTDTRWASPDFGKDLFIGINLDAAVLAKIVAAVGK